MSLYTKRTAIVVGGGPAPGINSVIGAATIRAIAKAVLSANLKATTSTARLTVNATKRLFRPYSMRPS